MIDEKILWERLKERREENKKDMPEICLYVNMGINQAIGIMNSLATGKTCGNCKYHDDFLWACTNSDSPRHGDFPDENDTCGAWEAKEPDDLSGLPPEIKAQILENDRKLKDRESAK